MVYSYINLFQCKKYILAMRKYKNRYKLIENNFTLLYNTLLVFCIALTRITSKGIWSLFYVTFLRAGALIILVYNWLGKTWKSGKVRKIYYFFALEAKYNLRLLLLISWRKFPSKLFSSVSQPVSKSLCNENINTHIQ